MITKERLKELIEQGATIYAIVKNPFIAGYSQTLEVEEFDLKAPFVKEISEDGKQFLYFNYLLDLEYLFETKEDAEWNLEMTATRIETLKMPKWEEVCDGCIYDITFIDAKKSKWQLTISDGGIALMDFSLCGRDKFWNKPTKENYIEACKLCLKLFKGEEV